MYAFTVVLCVQPPELSLLNEYVEGGGTFLKYVKSRNLGRAGSEYDAVAKRCVQAGSHTCDSESAISLIFATMHWM